MEMVVLTGRADNFRHWGLFILHDACIGRPDEDMVQA